MSDNKETKQAPAVEAGARDERAALDEGQVIAAIQKACGEYRHGCSYSFEDVWNCIEAALLARASEAVDAEAKLDAALTQVIDERDHFEDEATKLAERVGEYLGVDVGEWSSANDPLHRAMDALDEARAYGRASEAAAGEPVAWVRKHPDTGELSGDWLWNDAIEQCRKNSGVWFPLGFLAAPQPASEQQAARGLSDERIAEIAQPFLYLGDGDAEHDTVDWLGFARAILATKGDGQ